MLLMEDLRVNKRLQILKLKQDDIFTRASEILGTLAAPVRIRLIHFLSQAPLTVEVLSQKIEQSVANTSMHLRKMLNENLVQVETVGQKRLYSLHPAVFDFWERSQDFIQKIDPSLRLIDEEESLELNWQYPIDETIQMIKNNEITILDIRPQDESVQIVPDLKNLIHIPSSDIKENLNLIPKKKKVLVICRGRMCALSAFTVSYLRENNIKAYRLDQSWFVLNQSLLRKENV